MWYNIYRTKENTNQNQKETEMDIKKFKQLSKRAQAEVEDIYNDGYWTIVLKNYDRVISEETWRDVKCELNQMIKENDFTLQW